MIQNKEVLEQIREEAVKELNSYDCRILVCSGTGCVATGSQKIYEKFMEIAKMLRESPLSLDLMTKMHM